MAASTYVGRVKAEGVKYFDEFEIAHEEFKK